MEIDLADLNALLAVARAKGFREGARASGGSASGLDAKTLKYIAQLYQKQEWLLPSFYPVVGEGDRAMEDLKANYAFQFRNRPYEFHNGGLWPVWNGFLSLCLAGEEDKLAASLEEATGAACTIHDGEFNECFHGLTHEPIGVPQCSWSAAGYILAHNRHFKSNLII